MIFRDLAPADYNNFLRLYEDSFPSEERRHYADAQALDDFIKARNGKFRCFVAEDSDGSFAGFLTYWNFKGFTYVEHFAVNPEMRGNNIGTRMLRHLTEGVSPSVLLEVEMPETDFARRRIGFYERNGFRVRDEFKYIQPPYSPGLPSLELLLMTHGDVPLRSSLDLAEMLSDVYGVGK